jgi:hypothetical protein
MRNLLIMFTLLFTLLFTSVFFSSPSYAGWTKLGEGGSSVNRGDTFYVDFNRIRKVDGFVYYWRLTDYLKPTKYGVMSEKGYNQGACKLFWKKILSV